MHVADILKTKSGEVVGTGPGESIAATVRLLNAKNIGATIVLDAHGTVIGIISERDIIRSIAANGERALEMQVRDVMTSDVKSCKTTDTISEVMKLMTVYRFRHMPVIEDGELKGIVSIGDIVKNRLDETEMEARVLRDYVLANR